MVPFRPHRHESHPSREPDTPTVADLSIVNRVIRHSPRRRCPTPPKV